MTTDKRWPKYQVGWRVQQEPLGSGRVQGVTFQGGEFRYLVKWDVGRESLHLESELRPAELPPQYP